ncbi:hypothetical protein [Schaalia sp. ZJ1691]|uniref:hypothetical protein n=1 Tax=Schaalia sp. ZJ1691 TaxID=2709404 RepID=UPI0013ED1B5B|nr:hypothetical protein [Schaalia sp. ZJ1691]
MDHALVREFPPRTLDKVKRLLDLLAELGEHPLLKGKFALHGGTAINLFMLDMPRPERESMLWLQEGMVRI